MNFDEVVRNVALMPPDQAIAALDEALESGMDVNHLAQADEEEVPFEGGALDVSVLAMCESGEVAKFLLRRGADPNQEIGDGLTVLDMVLARASFPVLVQMLENGLEVEQDALRSTETLEQVPRQSRKECAAVLDAYFGADRTREQVVAWSVGPTKRYKPA